MNQDNLQPQITDQQAQSHASESPKTTPRVISNPNDVASLVLMQIDAVNSKKDELTIAIKGLADTTKQLVRSYAQQAAAIQKLNEKVKQLEEGTGKKSE